MRFFHYDRSPNEYKDDTAGHALAQKTMIQPDGSVRTIVAVMVRGAGYGAEWAGNMRTGSGEGHAGMMDAAEEVFQKSARVPGRGSTGAAVGRDQALDRRIQPGGSIANLLAARVAEGLPEIRRENIYVYTFVSPAAVTAGSPAQFKADFDHNHTADGQVNRPGMKATSIIWWPAESGGPDTAPPAGATTATETTAFCPLHSGRRNARH